MSRTFYHSGRFAFFVCLVSLPIFFVWRIQPTRAEPPDPAFDGFMKTILGHVVEDGLDALGVKDAQERDLFLNHDLGLGDKNAASLVACINHAQEHGAVVRVIDVADAAIPVKVIRSEIGNGPTSAIFLVLKTIEGKIRVSEKAFVLADGVWKEVVAEATQGNVLGAPVRARPQPRRE